MWKQSSLLSSDNVQQWLQWGFIICNIMDKKIHTRGLWFFMITQVSQWRIIIISFFTLLHVHGLDQHLHSFKWILLAMLQYYKSMPSTNNSNFFKTNDFGLGKMTLIITRLKCAKYELKLLLSTITKLWAIDKKCSRKSDDR